MFEGFALGFVLAVSAFIAAFIFRDVFSRNKKVRNVPGPLGYPLIGHVPYLTKEPWVKFLYWAGVHGAVYQLASRSKELCGLLQCTVQYDYRFCTSFLPLLWNNLAVL